MINNRHHIKNFLLADQGRRRIEGTLADMPVLNGNGRFAKERSLASGGCLHIVICAEDDGT
ncbi:MAG: hypothetical protein ACXWT1_19845 [Methylobacter sp.]